LTIAAENCVIDPMFAHMHLNAQVGCYVKITIEDAGTGIPPNVLDRIFDPFFTTKAPDKGTGLRLSTVIAIVKNHGGFLDVSTEVGCGTSFHVYLPAIEQDAELAIAPSNYLEGNGQLILAVDDEATMRQAMKASLEEHHYQALVAEDGITAITLYVQHPLEIGLVLLDLLMPSLDGFKLMAALAKINPQVRVVAMSGSNLNEMAVVIEHEHVRAFLAKPFTTQTLLQTVQQALTEL
jgi:CheY-like chemotaxis protein